jgi:hypothetical protein
MDAILRRCARCGRGAASPDAVAALKGTCGGTDLAVFEPAFEKAHTSLHNLIGMTGGHHEGDGTHQHQL